MNGIFLDTDVLLDFLLGRAPFLEEITKILERSAVDKKLLFVSPVTIVNIDYIITKLETRQKAKVKVGKLLQLVRVASMGQSTIDRAYHSEFSDFEDASQNYCAQENGHKTLITRNTKD